MTKFIKDNGGRLFGTLILLASFIAFSFILEGAVEDMSERNRLRDICVTVDAQITGIEETEDSEGDTEYKMYISYTYEGKEYSDIYYKTYSTTKNYGKTVSVEIDPENPSHLRPDSVMYAVIICGVLFLGSVCATSMMISSVLGTVAVTFIRKNIYEDNYLNEHIVKNDVHAEGHWRRIFAMATYALMLLFLAAKSFVSFQNTNSITLAVIYGIIVIISIVLSYFYLKMRRDACENISIVKSRLDAITTEKDSDGDPYTAWHFSGFDMWNGDKKCYISLCGQTIHNLRQGETVYIAYSGSKTIERIYNASEFSM